MPSKIEWTNETWNPTTGCSKVSPGCAHCYAETLSRRFGRTSKPWTPENSLENVQLHPDRLATPLGWKTPRRCFVDSMSDLFHEDIPDSYIDKVFAVMALAQRHTFQILTKRPERMRDYFADSDVWFKVKLAAAQFGEPPANWEWPLPNVWLGVTVENQHWANVRIPLLLESPAARHFLSAEPLLGPINLSPLEREDGAAIFPLDSGAIWPAGGGQESIHYYGGGYGARHVSWVIVGGESGPRHRAFSPLWAYDLLQQCVLGGDVAFFMKQLGGARPGNKIEDLPEELRVREYPDE